MVGKIVVILFQQTVIPRQQQGRSATREGKFFSGELGGYGAVKDVNHHHFLLVGFGAEHFCGHYAAYFHLSGGPCPLAAEGITAGVAADLSVANGNEAFLIYRINSFATAGAANDFPGGRGGNITGHNLSKFSNSNARVGFGLAGAGQEETKTAGNQTNAHGWLVCVKIRVH